MNSNNNKKPFPPIKYIPALPPAKIPQSNSLFSSITQGIVMGFGGCSGNTISNTLFNSTASIEKEIPKVEAPIQNNDCIKLKSDLTECLKQCNNVDMFNCMDLMEEVAEKCSRKNKT